MRQNEFEDDSDLEKEEKEPEIERNTKREKKFTQVRIKIFFMNIYFFCDHKQYLLYFLFTI